MVRASRRKYHFIYKTTCIVTGRFYIGMHSTDNLSDGYLGSGQMLWHSINKHGKSNHVCEILEYHPDRKTLSNRERELVTESEVKNEQCMNLRIGGDGYVPGQWKGKSNLHLVPKGLASKKRVERWNSDPEFRKSYSEKKRQSMLKRIAENGNPFAGRSHTVETKKKQSLAKIGKYDGDKNPSFGTCWITKDGQSIKIKRIDLDSYIQQGWVTGRKVLTKNET